MKLGYGKATEQPKTETKKVWPNFPPRQITRDTILRGWRIPFDCEIYTPRGAVEAIAGDVLALALGELWVLDGEAFPPFPEEIAQQVIRHSGRDGQ